MICRARVWVWKGNGYAMVWRKAILLRFNQDFPECLILLFDHITQDLHEVWVCKDNVRVTA